MRKEMFIWGKWADGYLYSILREEWKEPKILTRTEEVERFCLLLTYRAMIELLILCLDF